jgi:hypothetical protein
MYSLQKALSSIEIRPSMLEHKMAKDNEQSKVLKNRKYTSGDGEVYYYTEDTSVPIELHYL